MLGYKPHYDPDDFNSRRRSKGENIVNFAASLRQLAQLAYGKRDSGFVEKEIIDQSIKALDTQELRVGVSQADAKMLDEAVKIAIKLESIHLAEVQENSTKVNIPLTVLSLAQKEKMLDWWIVSKENKRK